MGLLVFLSFAAGLFLGVPIVARELERGTARLAWSLAPSRMRWFLARLLPVLALLAVVTFLAGIAAERFVASTTAETDLANSFTNFGFRGLLIASRAVFIFAVGVAVGSIVARALPAVILAAVIATIGLAGGERVHNMILASEAVVVPADQNNNPRQGDLFIDQKFVLPDGSLVDYGYFAGTDPYDQNGNPKYPIVNLVVPGDRYRFVETREALALAGGSLVALVLAGFVVSRRRPG
jgi:ABC-type transport system involved in multi-copper enzyme maturation permease subunit